MPAAVASRTCARTTPQDWQISAGIPEELQVDQVMCSHVGRISDSVKLLRDLVLQIDELNGLQISEPEVGTELHKLAVDLLSRMRVRIDLGIRDLNI